MFFWKSITNFFLGLKKFLFGIWLVGQPKSVHIKLLIWKYSTCGISRHVPQGVLMHYCYGETSLCKGKVNIKHTSDIFFCMNFVNIVSKCLQSDFSEQINTVNRKQIKTKQINTNIRSSESITIFKKRLLNFIRLLPNKVANSHNPQGLLKTLRLGISHLCNQRFKHNFLDTINLLCSCGSDI